MEIFKGEFVPEFDETPILRRFLRDAPSDYVPLYRYYQARGRVEQAQNELKRAHASGDPGLALKVKNEYGPLLKSYPVVKKVDRYLSKFRDKQKKVGNDDVAKLKLDRDRAKLLKQALVDMRKLGFND